MGKKSLHPQVAWRDGRPRFSPDQLLRAAGHRGRDLRHEDGRWFTMGEAIDWAADFRRQRLGDVDTTEMAPAAAPFPDNVESTPEVRRRGRPKQPYSNYQRGYIYFLWAGPGIKIGYSGRPFSRAAELMTGISSPMRMFFTVPGTMGDEQRLHRRLESQKLRGEWFKASRTTLSVLRLVLAENDGINAQD